MDAGTGTDNRGREIRDVVQAGALSLVAAALVYIVGATWSVLLLDAGYGGFVDRVSALGGMFDLELVALAGLGHAGGGRRAGASHSWVCWWSRRLSP